MGARAYAAPPATALENSNGSQSIGAGPQQPGRRILLDDSTSNEESGDDGPDGGVSLTNGTAHTVQPAFRVNEEYARRLEHNKKREELQKLEEKYGKGSAYPKRKNLESDDEQNAASDTGSSSESETEDDEGLLVTEALDTEITATLQAIREKDPRVYDHSVTFYRSVDEATGDAGSGTHKKEKPLYLRDYHRKNLLDGHIGEDQEDAPESYAQGQENLKKSIIEEMHAAVDDGKVASDDDDDDDAEDAGFLIPKVTSATEAGVGKSLIGRPLLAELDVESADKDPESFLSKFMSARAWVPTPASRFQPFESDDEEEDQRAEAFEEAYNFRFEDPQRANEKLLSHARDAAAKYSVRREEPNSRKKARDLQRSKKEAEKKERETEIARLRKLKVEEVTDKVNKIKEAAGLRGKTVREEDWASLIETDWDDENWEEEMNRRFGNSYYADEDVQSEDNGEGTSRAGKRRKVKKPKWDEDIDIKDLIPDFQDDEGENVSLAISDPEGLSENDAKSDPANRMTHNNEKSAKTRQVQEKLERRKQMRKERQKIEQLVEDKVNFEAALPPSKSKHAGHFRYRDTSPLTYGLTSQDILMASDSQLNQFAGLKKIAAFRDAEKKRKDKKKLGKKARLRQWRKETFGSEEGPQTTLSDLIASQAQGPPPQRFQVNGDLVGDVVVSTKKRKRATKRTGGKVTT